LAKVALDLDHAVTRRHVEGAAGEMGWCELAAGDGWSASDVICTAGPRERAFEEEHPAVSIAVVLAGTFQYRSTLGRELLSPGSLMLGNEGQRYECAHDHGTGDRCVLFRYTRAYLDRLGVEGRFGALRVPPLRPLAPLVAKASAGLAGAEVPWETLSTQLISETLANAGTAAERDEPTPAAIWRVTRSIRMIENEPDADLALDVLAERAGLSPFHFLRIFERLTGTTPHQYVLRMRLREAATRLATESGNILEIALDCGFHEASHFTRAFRTEFGVSPKAWRPTRTGGRTRRGR
jgi:AraC-like DNA-binding protein